MMEAWNQAWKTAEGRADWMTPEPFVVEMLEPLRAAGVKRILDLGFGVGRHAILLAKAGFEVDGIDASSNGLDFAQRWAQEEGVTLNLSLGDMSTLPYADGELDAILTWNVIYHGTHEVVQATIDELARCLQPHGHLVCSMISTRHFRFGEGVEIEPHVFVIPGGGEREHPHYYFDKQDIERCFAAFEILRAEDATQKRGDDYHWHLYARKKS
jgi:2-polyprenyl-3-methyl-5-hydroxy-6-metoxy-1,4-benzoquinol methylase